MEATEVLQVGGNGLVHVEGDDTRIRDIMCILNNIDDPTSELPGAVDMMSLQAPFFTAETPRRPFLAILYLNIVIQATKKPEAEQEKEKPLLGSCTNRQHRLAISTSASQKFCLDMTRCRMFTKRL
jgi:hypothetical protein